MARVVIFGLRENSSLAHFYIRNDSSHEVAAFSVNEAYMPEDKSFEGLPVVPFESVETIFPPGEFDFFVPMSQSKMGTMRKSIYEQAKAKGYSFIKYVSSKATVFANSCIGENCFILEDNTIQPFTSIGDNTILWSGNHIGHHSVIKPHVMFTSHVVLSGRCLVESFSYFGVNSTIRDGLKIAEGTFVGMAACVTKDTEPWGVYTGIPAKKGPRPSMDLNF